MPAIPSGLRRRSAAPEKNDTFNAVSILGFVVAALILVFALALIVVRYVRKHYAAKRLAKRGAAFLDVKGLVHSNDEKVSPAEEETPGIRLNNQFSRARLTASIILPNKARTRRGSPPSPTKRTTSTGSGHLSSLITFPLPSLGFLPSNQQSRPTRGLKLSTSALPSPQERRNSIKSPQSPLTPDGRSDSRRVRQAFTAPVLPDELLATRIGERLTILEAYSDGWCLVGRHAPSDSINKSLLGPQAPEETMETGVVPAWCFVKPARGMLAQRPMRNESLVPAHALPQGKDTMAPPQMHQRSRNDVVSWSNL